MTKTRKKFQQAKKDLVEKHLCIYGHGRMKFAPNDENDNFVCFECHDMTKTNWTQQRQLRQLNKEANNH